MVARAVLVVRIVGRDGRLADDKSMFLAILIAVIARLLLFAALLVAAPAAAEDPGWQSARAHARCVALAPDRTAHQRHLTAGYTLLKRAVEQEAGVQAAADLLAAHLGASRAEVIAYLYGEMVAEARQQVRDAMPQAVREERTPGDRDRWRGAEYDRTRCTLLR